MRTRHSDLRRAAVLAGLLAAGIVSTAVSRSVVPGQSTSGGATGEISISILDDHTGEPTAARIRLVDAGGTPVPPPGTALAAMWGRNDVAEGYAALPNGDFYVDGGFDMTLPAGTYALTITKGYEYLSQRHEVVVGAGTTRFPTYRLSRWVDMPARGWVSADDHIHLRRSPRENPVILGWIAAEDVHVGSVLQMGDFWATYYSQYAWGRDGIYQVEDRLLASGQEEPRTHERGHTISLAADDFVRLQDQYYYYDRLFDRIHELGGMTGYAHQAVTFHGYRGMTLDVLRDRVDFLELLQFCAENGPLHTQHYYHFLNLGFPLTATAGSDFPWCGRAPDGTESRIGDARFYTHVGDGFTFETWRENVRAGHTFVTSGPVLDLRVDDVLPGDRLDVAAGHRLRVRARAEGHVEQVPLSRLEIVSHGRVLATATPDHAGQSADRLELTLEVPTEHGLWIAARADAAPTQVAHTTPVYVSVDGSGFHDPATVERYLALSDQYLDELKAEIARPNDTLNQHAWRYREGLEAQIAETRAVIATLRDELPAGR